MARPEPSGLYLHIPFCASICNYCNFNRGLLDEGLKQAYVSALVREIELRATGEAADTIYFGGGTPSLLSPEEATRLIAACRAAFDVRPGAEITFEVNPETVDRAKLAAYREAGINRLSFGVQSFDDAELARLDRRHDAARARAAVADARAAGFDDISLDLMMWLPGQTVAGWLANVEALIALSPEHASLYLLEVYPNAPLKEAMARERWSVAADDDAAEMYERGMATLELAGYAQYEISNVARPGHESRHNVKYWTGGAWHGLGAGAHGTVGTRRWRNVADTRAFIAAVTADTLPEAEARVLPDEERLQEALFMGLRLRRGIDMRELGAMYGVDLAARYGERLAPYVTAGLLEPFEGGRLSLTGRGRLMANEVLSVFV